MNTTQDDDNMSQAEDQTNQPPWPAQKDWVNNVTATSCIYHFTGHDKVMILPKNLQSVAYLYV